MTWTWTMVDTWIVVAGALCAMSCALLGSFLVLRKMSMMGDAISHAVLPGIAVAFMLTQSRASLPMFVGAAVVGVLTAVLTQWVAKSGKVDESASMGVVFTGLFALGLLLVVQAANGTDLDASCVLYGSLEMTHFDTLEVFPAGFLGSDWDGEIPRSVVILGSVFVVNLLCVAVFYKELKISSFDPALATTLGIPAWVMHYLLMTLVAVTTVACFDSVGSILVMAMLIVPAAAAHLLTDRLPVMLLVACVIGAFSAIGGHFFAVTLPTALDLHDTNTSGMMAVVAGVVLTLAVVFSPSHGVAVGYARRLALGMRITEEDVLGILYRVHEARGTGAGDSVLREALHIGAFKLGVAKKRLVRRGQITDGPGGLTLTQEGRAQASQIIRTHRLWESYLSQQLGLPLDHLHAPAEALEHVRTRGVVEGLAAGVDASPTDPQGKPIPRAQDGGGK
jgi:manganese/zinc/iron transport system permease protein